MSNKYEDLIKNARMNADCGEHMSPAEVTTLLNVVETTFSALAAENALLKKSEPAPFSKLMMEALDVYMAGADEVPELAMLSAYKKLRDGLKTPATDAFLAEVRAQGVEMCSAEIQKQTWDEREGDGMVAAIDAMEIYAAQLRKGVQS
ncbi:hypothetical protein [Enterobacter asburiae]|uniref:hypothetical protein n=1 Tax=Enterobacter asburiae TaxID=61645 RepID=UPI002FF6B6FD